MTGYEADYIIVGSGSAGSVLADRLSAGGQNKVLVLEFGGTDKGPFIQMPSALSYPMNMPLYDWGYVSDPEPYLGGRRLACPRGKVIGGSSSINGMVYVRGHALDFDEWETMGAKGWGFRHVQPYFKRMENAHGGEAGWRGASGPMHVTRGRRENPLYQAFIDAGGEAGYPMTEDYNGHQQEGFGAMEMTVWRGRRWSAANAYLRPALKRPNLQLVTGAYVRRILLDGKKATAVEFEKAGVVKVAQARREIIIAASAINSPKILQLSGIGDGDSLQKAGVPVIQHLPGVGGNLQDHLEIYMQMTCKQPITLNSRLGLLSKARIGLEWLLMKRGLGATNHFEACGFIRSAAGVQYPDVQYHFLPAAMRYDGKLAIAGHGFQVHTGPMRSKSRGRVNIVSSDPRQAPSILFNYMSHDSDWSDFRSIIRLTREIMQQPALADFAAREIQPGLELTSDEALDEFLRQHVESAYHPCGTCRMGAVDDPLAVVDPETRVIGIDGLRVADSSIFPQITNGNLNGPSLMTGEKAADHILGRDPLSASNDQPWINPDWQSRQR